MDRGVGISWDRGIHFTLHHVASRCITLHHVASPSITKHHRMKKRINRIPIGLVAGIMLPMLALSIYHRIRFENSNLWEFLQSFYQLDLLTHVISLAVIPNLLLFFGFINFNLLKAARGVLMATILMALLVVVLRFT